MVWTAGGGVSVLRTDGTWQTFNSGNSGLLYDYVGAIAIDKTGNKWFGSVGADSRQWTEHGQDIMVVHFRD